MDPFSRPFQQFRDNGRGRGFAVASGHGDFPAGTDREKRLHFRRETASALHGGAQFRQIRPDTGRAENHVFRQIFQIVRPQTVRTAHCPQFFSIRAEILFTVADRNRRAVGTE